MSMIDKLRAELRDLLAKRDEHQDELDAILAAAEARDDSNLTEDETTKFAAARDAIKAADEARKTLEERITDLEDLEARRAERDRLAAELHPEPLPETQRQVRVRSEAPTYSEDPNGPSFFRDVFQSRIGDQGAIERLQRHNAEVRASVGTAAFGDGLVVPQYLPELYAENLRAGRVTANLCSALPLPDKGMTITIPRGTTGTSVAAQSDENSAVSSTTYDETDLTFYVRTYAGQQDVSRQAWERGFNVDAIIYADLAAAYATSLNADVINGLGTNGTHTGILQTSGVATVTASGTASQTQVFVVKKILEALGTVAGSRYMPATGIVMHPRRWSWILAGVDETTRPLVVPAGQAVNSFGTGDAAAYGFAGEIAGVPVWTDGSIPTTLSSSTFSGSTEDAIIVTRRSDLLLAEEDVAPRRFRFEETGGGELTVKAVVAGYSAFTAGWYPTGTVKITGSSLTTPTF